MPIRNSSLRNIPYPREICVSGIIELNYGTGELPFN